MKQDNTDRMFDKRVVRRNISTGRIESEDYDRFLNALPDVTENIKASDEGGDNDGYEEDDFEDDDYDDDDDDDDDDDQSSGDAAAGFGSPTPGSEPPTGA